MKDPFIIFRLMLQDIYELTNEVLDKTDIYAEYKGKEYKVTKVFKKNNMITFNLHIDHGNGKKTKKRTRLQDITDMYLKEDK